MAGKAKNKIIIEVEGGLVTSVYSSNKNIEVAILDRDVLEEDENRMEETLFLEEEAKNMATVF